MSRSILIFAAMAALLAGCQKAATTADADAGKALFDQHCAVCHGPAGDVRNAEAYAAETPDLREIARNSAGGYVPSVMLAEIIDGRRVVAAHGDRKMPVWGEQFGGEDEAAVKAKIESLVAYIESIQVR